MCSPETKGRRFSLLSNIRFTRDIIKHVINDNKFINNVTKTYIMKLHLHEHERVCDEIEKKIS